MGIGSKATRASWALRYKQHHADAHKLQRLHEEAAGHVVDQGMQGFRVVGHLAHEHARLVSIVEGQRQLVELLHQLVAKIGGQRCTDATGDPSLPNGHEGGSQAGQQEAGNDGQQQREQLTHRVLHAIGL